MEYGIDLIGGGMRRETRADALVRPLVLTALAAHHVAGKSVADEIIYDTNNRADERPDLSCPGPSDRQWPHREWLSPRHRG
ncbi:MAG TPA: hypothetical protein VFV09_03990, partial [Actinomycetota bacterium]|nr:hypothetical protein [Actinomycetota bacterium]